MWSLSAVTVRVKAKTEPDTWRTLTYISRTDCLSCSCGAELWLGAKYGNTFCSHIDAVCRHGETAMVHPDDVQDARALAELIGPRIDVPPDWRASWQNNRSWRNVELERPSSGGAQFHRDRDPAKLVVAFTGKFLKSRDEMRREAEEAGWETINTPSRTTDILVVGGSVRWTAKLVAARENGTEIITAEQWEIARVTGELPDDLEDRQC